MKLFHISDLHLGKRVHEFSMLEDQEYILREILRLIDDEQPDGLLVAGDVYDKAVPPAEAVGLFDRFLCELADRRVPTFVISGNHDSPERIAFGSQLMQPSGIHMSPVYHGEIAPLSLTDDFGVVNVYLLPFVRPATVRRFWPEEEIASYTDAVGAAIRHMPIDPAARNVLVTHQFVTGAARSESEDISVGGTDNVDAAVMDIFDYVALGHIHGPQKIGRDTLRYCGTPLKYSFSEAAQQKSVTVVELREKGDVTVRTLPLTPRRDLRELRGRYDQLTLRSFYETQQTGDYLHITLTDEQDIPDAIGKLRVIYPQLMKLDYDNARTRAGAVITGTDAVEQKSPLELFDELYEKQNNQPMSNQQRQFAAELIRDIWKETP